MGWTDIIFEEMICEKEGIIRLKQNGKWGLIDENGNEILPPTFYEEFEFIKILSDDYIKIKLDGDVIIIDKKGNIVR
ncbi:WG repeat-containing protein [Campylobacter sp. JMF_01 NE2]|uniref:WG repeat-containing protein n=1 Tax=unclassified Campylobacter TaxID=2593542 RepID=UPI0022E9A555|nr:MULTISPECIES: WG repeat-containing protein [unclassified Campylobacter]MDA3051900.1 WG repeat-containing protein [Campylobacter sp. JMF_03 NE3]MDA3066234.1 WG repeat-containing protein [Campylobacter sp. JMF_01 NE2]